MNTFSLVIQDENGRQEFTGVTSFVGEDGSGSFGILAGHARLITALVMGLARFRVGADAWSYIAVPGAVLYFLDNVLTLSARRAYVDGDFDRISKTLQEQLVNEEQSMRATKQSLRRMEEEVFRRLWDMGRRGG